MGGPLDPKGEGKRRPRFAHPQKQWGYGAPYGSAVTYDVDLRTPAVWEPMDGTASADGASDAVAHEYDDTTCPICTMAFAHGEVVVRLQCLHTMHTECFNHYLHHASGAIGFAVQMDR